MYLVMWFQCMMIKNKNNFCVVVDYIMNIDDEIYKMMMIVVEFVGYCIFCELY